MAGIHVRKGEFGCTTPKKRYSQATIACAKTGLAAVPRALRGAALPLALTAMARLWCSAATKSSAATAASLRSSST
jgi:hypothetical protein